MTSLTEPARATSRLRRVRRSGRRWAVGGLAVAAVALVAGCSSSSSSTTSTSGGAAPASTAAGPPCPVAPVDVVVTVGPWTDLVQALGGACVRVRTIISGGDADPHDYEPTPGDQSAIAGAKLVVRNGAHYDEWAEKAVDALSTKPVVVDAAEVAGRAEDGNPHLWYAPDELPKVGAAVTAALKGLLPGADAYLDERAAAWDASLVAYRDQLQQLRAVAAGKAYAATEPLADDLAAVIGLRDATPPGYRAASAAESEPGPGDVARFQELLRNREVQVLIVNTQTEGALVEQLRSAAEAGGVPVVEMTETAPPGSASFVEWQLGQMRQLQQALAGGR